MQLPHMTTSEHMPIIINQLTAIYRSLMIIATLNLTGQEVCTALEAVLQQEVFGAVAPW